MLRLDLIEEHMIQLAHPFTDSEGTPARPPLSRSDSMHSRKSNRLLICTHVDAALVAAATSAQPQPMQSAPPIINTQSSFMAHILPRAPPVRVETAESTMCSNSAQSTINRRISTCRRPPIGNVFVDGDGATLDAVVQSTDELNVDDDDVPAPSLEHLRLCAGKSCPM